MNGFPDMSATLSPHGAQTAAERLLDEAVLIEQCRAGDDAAFDDLVDRHKRDAFALAYRLVRDRDLARDVVQEAFVKLYAILARWNGSCQVRTWLYRVISNACVDVHRRRRRFVLLADLPAADRDDLTGSGHEPDPRQAMMRQELADHLGVLVDALPARMQLCCRLRYFGGLDVKAIAEVMACAQGTVKAMLFQSRDRLRKAFGTALRNDSERSLVKERVQR